MTYPQTWLTRPVRRGIMITLIVLFFIISPAIILYTAGYRYDVRQRRIKQTGVVSIDIQPADATVYLNDVLLKKRMPIRLTNRAPGTYQVRIEREGYHPWLQDVTVDSNQTTYIKDITLFAQTLPISISGEREIIDTAFSYDGSFLLATTKENGIYAVLLYSALDDTWETVSRSTVNPKLSWSQSGIAAIIMADERGTRVERVSPIEKAVTNAFQFSSRAGELQWGSRDVLFIQDSGSLFSLQDKETVRHSAVTSSLWFVDNNNDVWTINGNRVLSDGTTTIIVPRDVSPTRILAVDENKVLLETLRGITILRRQDDRVTTIPAKDAVYDTKFKRWIAWSPIEIWTINENGRENLEDRLSDKTIDLVRALNQYQSLVYSTGDSINVLNPGYSTHQQLFADLDITDLGVNTRKQRIYFFGTVGSKKGVFALPLSR